MLPPLTAAKPRALGKQPFRRRSNIIVAATYWGRSKLTAMKTRQLSTPEAADLISRRESHFFDFKSSRSKGSTIEKIAVALANAEGGEFVVGIEDPKLGSDLVDRWKGFESEEDGNGIFQSLALHADPPVPYSAEWLSISDDQDLGLVCRIHILKSPDVHKTSGGKVYVRRNAQNLEISGAEVADLALSKGTRSYEDKYVESYGFDRLSTAPALVEFLASFSPRTEPLDFAMSQELVSDDGRVTVAGALLYSENPSATVPRRCAVRISRYATKESEAHRDHLEGAPITVEGPMDQMVNEALAVVQHLLDGQQIQDPTGALVPMHYPPDALKEVIVNAAIHRDFNVSNDVQVRVFDNRIEVESPGTLPGHITVANLGTTRFGRNPTIVRLLSKYPDALNKDIGDGIKTVRRRMKQAKLAEPEFTPLNASFLVTLKHTPLARPQEIVLRYLANQANEEVTNSIARGLTGIESENTMKEVFYSLKKSGWLEPVPEKRGAKSAWRLTKEGEVEAANLTIT